MDVKKKKSSSSTQPSDRSVRYPKMSPEMFERLCDVRDKPQFILILHQDDNGKIEYWFEVGTDFPKEEILPGVMKAMESCEKNFIRNFKETDQETVDRLMGELEAMAAEEEPQEHPKAEEWRGAKKPVDNILTLKRDNVRGGGKD